MLYVFEEVERLDDAFPERCAPALSEQRRAKVEACRFPLDKKLSAAVYLLLRLGLREEHGIREPVRLAFAPGGKPFLPEHPGICFNLSHCRAAAACAVSNSEVGVDVQEPRPVSDRMARRVLTADEYGAFKAAEDPGRLFCEYWTVKESYVKKTGQGVGAGLSALPAGEITNKTLFHSGPDYYGCAAGDCGPLRLVRAEELLAVF